LADISAKTAIVQGTLKERPFPRLLQQLFRKKFTGYCVVVDETHDESEVYLRGGSPVHVCRPVDTDRLGNLLVEYGVVSADIVAAASAEVTEGTRLGDVLERMGALDKQKLAQVLKSQVVRKLTRLFFVLDGSYAIYVASHAYGEGADFALMRVDPRSVIYPGIRAAYDLPRVTQELTRLLGLRFRLGNVSPGFIAAMGIAPEDATVEALRAGWMTLDDLDGITSRPLEVRSMVLALYYSDLLDREPIFQPAQPPADSAIPRAVHLAQSSDVGLVFKLPGDSGPELQSSDDPVPAIAPQGSEAGAARPKVAPTVGSRPTPPPPTAARPPSGERPSLAPRSTVPSGIFSSFAAPVPAATAPKGIEAGAAQANATSTVGARPTPSPAGAARAPSGERLSFTSGTTRPSGIFSSVSAASRAVPAAVPSVAAGGGFSASSKVAPAGPGPTAPVVHAPFVSTVRPDAKSPPAAASKAASATRSVPAPAPEAVRASIQEMAQKLGKVTHFELLGVGQNASSDEVGTAFVRAARQFHPDRLISAGLQDLQPLAEKILARINEAAMILGNATRRAEYVASLAAGPQAARTNLPTLLEAENMFLRGEVFLKRGEHAKAIECFTHAQQGNPGEPQYRAYQAWARFDDPRARKEALVRETLATLEEVLRDRPKFVRGFYWVGLLWKFLNEADKAERAFREAVTLDTSFIEASRELRLIEMRKHKHSASRPSAKSEPTSGGLMGKFFKK